MTWFVVIATAMAALALMWVLPALWRGGGAHADVEPRASNLGILKDQLAELEADVAAGTLLQQQYAQAREDLERRALEEARDSGASSAPALARAGKTAIVLAAAFPLCAALIYWQLGTPAALSPEFSAANRRQVTPQEVEAMVAKLAARLKESPDDGNGWALLARSYLVMKRYPESAAAYERATTLLKDDADLLADYADALAGVEEGRLDGKPLQLLERALSIDPAQWKALALAGTAAFNRKDYTKAVDYWGRLQSRAEPGSDLARTVGANIEEARQLGGLPAPATAGATDTAKSAQAAGASASTAASVSGTVSLDKVLAGKADPSDTVFIFARATAGPRMPLAIVKRQVKDLPYAFTLDDTQAMSPEMTLSRFPEVVVTARVSKSASAAPQSGDLQGSSKAVKPGDRNIAVVIDSRVP